MTLRLDWCSYDAARFAVSHWHYSKSLPTPPLVRIGVWEDSRFVGCVIFGRGATPNLLKPYGITQTQGCELVRVALSEHQTPVSRILSIAIKMLKKSQPGLRLVVSFADANENHHGGIYQASGWLYTGSTGSDVQYIDARGRKWHGRQVSSTGVKPQYGELRRVPKHSDLSRVRMLGKHRYLYPLDDDMRRQIEPLRKPYPKRADSVNSSTAGVQPDGGGANPTSALLHKPEAADG